MDGMYFVIRNPGNGYVVDPKRMDTSYGWSQKLEHADPYEVRNHAIIIAKFVDLIHEGPVQVVAVRLDEYGFPAEIVSEEEVHA